MRLFDHVDAHGEIDALRSGGQPETWGIGIILGASFLCDNGLASEGRGYASLT